LNRHETEELSREQLKTASGAFNTSSTGDEDQRYYSIINK